MSDDVLIKPFSLHSELALKIKTSLLGGRKDSPIIRIDMPFDEINFDGGLGACGFN